MTKVEYMKNGLCSACDKEGCVLIRCTVPESNQSNSIKLCIQCVQDIYSKALQAEYIFIKYPEHH
jgi:hypothetical protein